MHFAPFAAIIAIACAVFVVALPVPDLVTLDAHAPEAFVARAPSP